MQQYAAVATLPLAEITDRAPERAPGQSYAQLVEEVLDAWTNVALGNDALLDHQEMKRHLHRVTTEASKFVFMQLYPFMLNLQLGTAVDGGYWVFDSILIRQLIGKDVLIDFVLNKVY